jgi:hypothetical protein
MSECELTCLVWRCECCHRRLGLSQETLVRLEDAMECDETECTEAEASTPHRHMVVSRERPNAGPQIFPFKL